MSSSWATIGNVAHVVSLVSVATFAFCVATQRQLFDAYWKEWGFCVANVDVPYWNSHDLCFYTDTFLAFVVGVMYMLLYKEPGMQPANDLVGFSTLGVLGHGAGHGAIAAGMRNGYENMLEDGQKLNYEVTHFDSAMEFALKMGPYLFFWIALLKSAVPKGSWSSIAGMSAASMALGLIIPKNLGFTYVQTILFLAFDINEMLKPKKEKGFEYALYPIMVGIPVSVVGWIESTMCTKGVIDIGGHLIYDACIPLCMLAFYMVCYLRTQATTAATEKKQKAA
mgnify:CR=1 FL=1